MNKRVKRFKKITPYNIKITVNEAKKQALRWEKPVDRLNQMLETIDAINESNKILNEKLKAAKSKTWKTRYEEQLRANELATRDIANELISDFGVLRRNIRSGDFSYNKYWINDLEDIMLDRRLDTIKLMYDIAGGSMAQLQDMSLNTPRQAARLEELAMGEFANVQEYRKGLDEYVSYLNKSKMKKAKSPTKIAKRKANKLKKSKRKAQRKARKINRRR